MCLPPVENPKFMVGMELCQSIPLCKGEFGTRSAQHLRVLAPGTGLPLCLMPGQNHSSPFLQQCHPGECLSHGCEQRNRNLGFALESSIKLVLCPPTLNSAQRNWAGCPQYILKFLGTGYLATVNLGAD